MSGAKATLIKDWNPKKTVAVDTNHLGEDFAQYIYPMHSTSADGKLPVIIQMPWTTMQEGGLPKKGSEYHETEDKCTYYNHNLLPENPNDVVALKKLQEFDEYFGSKEFRQKQFGKKNVDNHAYCQIVRKKQPKIDKKTGEAIPSKYKNNYYIKIKLITESKKRSKDSDKDKKKKKIDSSDESASDSDDDSKKKKKKNDKNKKDKDKKPAEPEFSLTNPKVITEFHYPRPDGQKGYDKFDVNTVDDARKVFPWNCEFRDILKFAYVWEKKQPDRHSGIYEYGVTIKVPHIYVKPRVRSSNYVDANVVVTDNEASDNEDGPASVPSKTNAKAESKHSSKKDSQKKKTSGDESENSDSEEDGSDSDSDDESTSKKKKKPTSGDESENLDSEKDDSGSDSDDDSSAKKKNKASSKKKKNSDSDSGSDSDDDEPDSKKKAKGKKASSDSDSESGSDESDSDDE